LQKLKIAYRSYIDVIQVIKFLEKILIQMPTVWFVVKHKNLLLKDYTDNWIEKHGIWEHPGKSDSQHNKLSMAYAWRSNYIDAYLLSPHLLHCHPALVAGSGV
jgi:hypothetical protein